MGILWVIQHHSWDHGDRRPFHQAVPQLWGSVLVNAWLSVRQSVAVKRCGYQRPLGLQGSRIQVTRSRSHSAGRKCTSVAHGSLKPLFLVGRLHNVGLRVCCCALSHVVLCVMRTSRCNHGDWLEALNQSRRSIRSVVR